MAEIRNLNVVDDLNTARFPEGQAPSTVNDGARAGEGIYARGFKDTIDTTIASTGASNAYAVTTSRGVPDGETGLYDGFTVTFRANHDNTGAATLTVTLNTAAQPVKDLRDQSGAPLASGTIFQNGYVTAIYYATGDYFVIVSNTASPLAADQSPQLTGDLDVNGKDITSNLTNGNVTITPPGTGRLITPRLTLAGVTYPDADGSANQVLTTDGAGAASWASVARIVEQAIKTGPDTVTSETYTDITGLSVTVTPPSTSSKVVITAMVSGSSATSASQLALRLERNGSPIFVADAAGSRVQATAILAASIGSAMNVATINYVDEPNTTSATTYTVAARKIGSPTCFINRQESDGDVNTTPRAVSSIVASIG